MGLTEGKKEETVIRIGTRSSRLALAQTQLAADAIKKVCPEARIEIVPLVTKGDKILGKPLTEFGGKGAFVEEFERALLEGDIDLAVHSAKDLPEKLADGLGIEAVLKRGDPRDVLVTVKGRDFGPFAAEKTAPEQEDREPAPFIVGTGSPRRRIQIEEWLKRHWNRTSECRLLRGNVNTRLEKLWNGEYDGIVLAAAGLLRLGMDLREDPRFLFTPLCEKEFIPAGGQAVIAIEARKGETLGGILTAVNDEKTMRALLAERDVLRRFGVGCNGAAAVYGWEEAGQFHLKMMVETERGLLRRELDGLPKEALTLSKRIASGDFPGFVSLVGAGPGDPGLITQKGLAALKRAEVLIYDRLIPEELLRHVPGCCERIYAGKAPGRHSMAQEEINRLLVKKAGEGKRVVRLKGGDPFVFGRGGEEIQELIKAGIPYEVIPGVTSAVAALSSAGIPVTHRGLAESFHVITGHRAEGVLKDLPLYAKLPGTLVFLMGLSNLEQIAAGLISGGMDPETPSAAVMEGTRQTERCVRAPLWELSRRVREAGLHSPAVIAIGPAARFSFTCRERGPLSGALVGITGTEEMYEKLSAGLSALGAGTVRAGILRVKENGREALRQAVRELSDFRWIVFTSRNGIRFFFEAMRRERIDFRCLSDIRFAAVGRGTADFLEGYGFAADYMPERFTTEELARGLAERIQKEGGMEPGKRILIPRAAQGSPKLLEILMEAGFDCCDLPVYDVEPEPSPFLDYAQADYLTFESASGVRGFFLEEPEKKKELLLKSRPVCIGEATAAALREFVPGPILTARSFTAEGIAEVILEDWKRAKGAQDGRVYLPG